MPVLSIPELYQLVTLTLSTTSLARLPLLLVIVAFFSVIGYTLVYPSLGPYAPTNVMEKTANIMEDAKATYALLKSEGIAQLADEEEYHRHSAAYDALSQQLLSDLYYENALFLHPLDSFRYWRDAWIWRSNISSWVNKMKTSIRTKQLSSRSINPPDDSRPEGKSASISSEPNTNASSLSVNTDDDMLSVNVDIESYPLSFVQGSSSDRGDSVAPPSEEDITDVV
ncbi:hypothetical protein EDD18DRAFT_1132736 [Armillaria luteobubalina]|uniref:Uncharacterized protein n=1 Tax=Armillaria luteobubalina TaxID=153913 RepID=A0AA39QMC4_9AGAR|nr:hypothetical protein EDD18DRAFT_1132736 [Armillaria luteobubalina]